mgnify:CR=1 FL=1
MLGPQGGSLLHKLGGKLAYELPTVELEALVAKAQEKRSIDRAIGRLHKMITDPSSAPRSGSKVKRLRAPKTLTLESAGLMPSVASLLRKQWDGHSDIEILQLLQGKGLL